MNLIYASWFFILARSSPSNDGVLDFINKCIDIVDKDNISYHSIKFFKIQCESSEDCPNEWTCDSAIGICFITRRDEYDLTEYTDFPIFNAQYVQSG